jgi:tetratricopeptide (TPR) repeat protein
MKSNGVQKLIVAATVTVAMAALLAACESLPVFHSVWSSPRQSVPLALLQAEEKLDKEDYEQAASEFKLFTEENPNSAFVSRSQINLGRAQIGAGQFVQGLQTLQNLLHEKLGHDPEIVALCTYYSHEAYLRLGEDLKAKAALKDAEGMAADLPREIAYAEIPSKLAILYRQEDDWANAKLYFARAQGGAERVFAETDPSQNVKKAALYFAMGQFANQSQAGEPVRNLQILETLQLYLLRAIELQDPTWSLRAKKDLQQSYTQIWNSIMMVSEGRSEKLAGLTTNIEKLKALGPVEANSDEKELFAFLSTLESRAEALLREEPAGPALTPDAVRRNRLRREGVVYSAPLFPNEKLPGGKKKIKENSTDPNLERK